LEEEKIEGTITRIPQHSFTVLDFIRVFKKLYPADWLESDNGAFPGVFSRWDKYFDIDPILFRGGFLLILLLTV